MTNAVAHDELMMKSVSLFAELKAARLSAQQLMSNLDKQVGHCYHILELLTLDAVAITKVTKRMKTLLQERRAVKEQVSQLDSLLNSKVHDAKVLDNPAKERNRQYTNEAIEMYRNMFGVQYVQKNKT